MQMCNVFPSRRKSFASVCLSTSPTRALCKESSREQNTEESLTALDAHQFDKDNTQHCCDLTIRHEEYHGPTGIPQEYWDELFESAFLALNQAPYDWA